MGAPRAGIVDLGSNSIRLVIFEGHARDPSPIFNEKAIVRLGRGLSRDGRLDPEARGKAEPVLRRYHAIAGAFHADPFEVIATAAVRDAEDGAAFAEALRTWLPGVPLRVLSGEEEARLSAAGVACGSPGATGVMADLGGGSLELVRLRDGVARETATLPLGVIRLAERAGGDVEAAHALTEAALADIGWLPEVEGEDLFAVGGTWRALARTHINQVRYPIPVIHLYSLDKDEARAFAGSIASAGRRTLEKLPGLNRRRIDDAPFAAVVLRRVLRASRARRVIFSAAGLREGWYMSLLPPEMREADPLLAAARAHGTALARDPALPLALLEWMRSLFAENPVPERLLEAACWFSDIGAREHPEFRAEQAFNAVLRHPGIGLDHHARAFLATAVACRYDAPAGASFLAGASALLEAGDLANARTLGLALRLAYMLCAGTSALLASVSVARQRDRLVLRLRDGSGMFSSDSVTRRLAALASVLGLVPEVTSAS